MGRVNQTAHFQQSDSQLYIQIANNLGDQKEIKAFSSWNNVKTSDLGLQTVWWEQWVSIGEVQVLVLEGTDKNVHYVKGTLSTLPGPDHDNDWIN